MLAIRSSCTAHGPRAGLTLAKKKAPRARRKKKKASGTSKSPPLIMSAKLALLEQAARVQASQAKLASIITIRKAAPRVLHPAVLPPAVLEAASPAPRHLSAKTIKGILISAAQCCAFYFAGGCNSS